MQASYVLVSRVLPPHMRVYWLVPCSLLPDAPHRHAETPAGVLSLLGRWSLPQTNEMKKSFWEEHTDFLLPVIV